MFCSKCGRENAEETIFCVNCGTPIKKDIAATVPTPASTSPMQKSIKKNGRLVGIIAAIVVVVAIVGVAAYGFGLFGASVKDSVADYTWEELSNISNEISETESEEAAIEVAKRYNLTNSDGMLDGSQTKDVQLSNGQTVQVQIAGFRHDEKTSGGYAGITFIFLDAIANRGMNSTNTTAGGWENSQMRSWLASEGMNMLPSELRNEIVEVNKETEHFFAFSDPTSSASTDKLWLYSNKETRGDTTGNGSERYKLFRDGSFRLTFIGNSSSNKGGDIFFWLRNPLDSNLFLSIGTATGSCVASADLDVVPGFCI